MARRGQCRCGLVLTFHRTAKGYKMRCPSCGAVVRLRVEPKRRKPPADPHPAAPPAAEAPPAPDEFDVELMPLPAPPGRPGRAWLLLVVGGVTVLLLAVAAGAAWWFLN
jgi:hypothetical protein